MAQCWEILNGPSKFDLMVALFDRNGDGGLRRVTFMVKETGAEFVPMRGAQEFKLEVTVHAVGSENEQGDCWVLRVREKNGHQLIGNYRSDHRKGQLEDDRHE